VGNQDAVCVALAAQILGLRRIHSGVAASKARREGGWEVSDLILLLLVFGVGVVLGYRDGINNRKEDGK
jgi:hypothetical protein